MRHLTTSFIFATALVVAPTVHAQTRADSALTQWVTDFEAAYNAKDAAKIASFYAEDALLIPPDEPMVKGRSAIQARLERELTQGNFSLKITPIHSAVTGDSAHEVGTVAVTLPDGKVINQTHVVLFKRVGGEWKIAYDIWNSSAPPMPQK